MRTAIYCLLFFLLAFQANAGLDEELGAMFSDMVNTTPGDAYKTQRRGVITGGNMALRNRVVNPNLISFVPPGIKSGCGGIDMFGGSFSYINSEQLTQLMRSIAQAAVGYAFQLAIEGMCPTCAQVISKLQKDVAFINSQMRNSCSAAKHIVDSALKPGLESINETFSDHLSTDLSANTGFVEDFFAAREDKTQSPAQHAISAGKSDLFTGNVVHQSLTNSNAVSWYRNGDEQLKRVLMSLTGTYIADKNSDNTDIAYIFRPPTIEPRDFIEGGNLKLYDCESDDCLLSDATVNTVTVSVTGMRDRIKKMLFGTGTCATCTGGIVRKLDQREGGEVIDSSEAKFIEATSPGVQGILNRVAHEPQAAAMIADRMIDVLAVEMTNQIVDEMFETVNQSVASSGKKLDTKILDVMRDRRNKINEQRRAAGEALASIAFMMDLYKTVDTSLRTPSFHRPQ